MEKETTIPGLDTPRTWILTDGQEIDQEANLFDWEAASANKQAKLLATGDNWRWILKS